MHRRVKKPFSTAAGASSSSGQTPEKSIPKELQDGESEGEETEETDLDASSTRQKRAANASPSKTIKEGSIEQPSGSDVESDGRSAREFESRMERSHFDSSQNPVEQRLNLLLNIFSPRWRNWIIRALLTFVILASFSLLIYLGPIALAVMTFALQTRAFYEVTRIGHVAYRADKLTWFRSLNWYLFVIGNFFFFGQGFVMRVLAAARAFDPLLISRLAFMDVFITYHSFLLFVLYVIFLMFFVITLRKRYYFKQFTMFAWTHMTILIISTTANFGTTNLLRGLIWFVLPALLIVINDIFAYLAGFFFGRTPLIKLSPKKTWEGFIGGLIATVILGVLVAWVMTSVPYFLCSVEMDELLSPSNLTLHGSDPSGTGWRSMFRVLLSTHTHDAGQCKVNPVFIPSEFILPHIFRFTKLPNKFTIMPFTFHTLVLALFASLIAPFAGFFASGFKRAFKIKDFSDMIPGHGGIVDRFDCQVLMISFTFVYYESFIKVGNPERLLHQVHALRPDQQLEFYQMLASSLQLRGLLPALG